MKDNFPDYDFLGSVYIGTNCLELIETLDSIITQTLAPKNVVIVVDGFISKEVYKTLNIYKKKLPLKLIFSKNNLGLGLSLRKGLKKCKSKIILRFDTDDINFSNRAYLQVKELISSNIDVVGSQVYEFESNPNKFLTIKKVPLNNKQIKKQIIFRNPMNHPTVGFYKDSIMKLDGGYRDFPLYEDYDLWIRAISHGLKFKNISIPLVSMRIKNQRARRRGFNIIIKESRLIGSFFKISPFKGFIFLPIFLIRSLIALLPLSLFSFLYKFFFRERHKF